MVNRKSVNRRSGSASIATCSMFEPASAIAAATWANTPRVFLTSTRMRISNSLPSSGSHSTSIHFCGSDERDLRDRRAIVGVNDQAATLADRANDRITRNRLAAMRQLDGHAFGPVNRQGHAIWRTARHVLTGQQTTGHHRRQTLAKTNVGIQFFDRFLATSLDQLVPGISRNRNRPRHPAPAIPGAADARQGEPTLRSASSAGNDGSCCAPDRS